VNAEKFPHSGVAAAYVALRYVAAPIVANHMRSDETSELVLDEAWKESLSPLKQRAIDFGTLLSRQTLPMTGAVRRN